MKKIALFAHKLTSEYASTVAKGVSDFFADKNEYQLFITQTTDPDFTYNQYDYQFWADAELLKNTEIDLYIVISASYCTTLDKNDIANLLRPFSSNKPLVSIGMDLPLGDIKFVDTDVDSAYLEIVKHLKNHHHCKKIGFMSANLTASKEAEERLEAFKKAMKICNLEINPEWILDGTFREEEATNEILKKYKSKQEVPFQALICANDLMAIGSIKAFQKIGLKVPKDIKVFGFDDTSHAYTNSPTISTVNQHMRRLGFQAGEIAFNILEHKEVPIEIKNSAHVHYRQSCGCISLNTKHGGYKSKRNGFPFIISKKQESPKLGNYISVETLNYVNKLYSKIRFLKKGTDYFEIEKHIRHFGIESITLCTYPKPVKVKKGEPFILPDTAIARMHVDTRKNIKNFYEEGISFNPRVQLLPDILAENEPGKFIVQTAYDEEFQYGYFVCTPKNDNYSAYPIYLDVLSKLSIDYSLKNDKFFNLSKSDSIPDAQYEAETAKKSPSIKNTTDELTQLLNLDGFTEFGQRQISLATEMKNKGLLIYADIESLKFINNTFGRETGNKAIALEARVLSQTFRKTDVIGRVNGEEFGVVVQGCALSQLDLFRKKIEEANLQVKKDENLPFELLTCITGVEFDAEHNNIKELLQEAKKLLDEEKITLL